MDLKTFVSAVFVVTLVMDPVGNIPMFMLALKEVPQERKRAVVARELFIALGLIMFFLLFGKYVVSLLAMEKLMGMILTTISVQMVMSGLKKSLAG